LVEAPGTAPGSEWFITTAIYRHSRQAGVTNIGPQDRREKSHVRSPAGPPVSERMVRGVLWRPLASLLEADA